MPICLPHTIPVGYRADCSITFTHSVYHSHARSWHGFQNEILRRLLTVSLEENERIKITNDKELLLCLTNYIEYYHSFSFYVLAFFQDYKVEFH